MDHAMKTCPYCAESISDDPQFCPHCGTNLKPLAAGSLAAGTPAIPPGDAPTSGKAKASLIFGIFFFILPASITAIVLGTSPMPKSTAVWDASEDEAWRWPD